MKKPIPADEIVFNGVHGIKGSPLLMLSPAELEAIALKNGLDFDPDHLAELKERQFKAENPAFDLEFGRATDDLSQAGWGVVFPARADKDNKKILDIRGALSELLDWRKAQAGDLYKELIGEDGVQPNESANHFMGRHAAAPGTVDPTNLPYYLLIVGDVDEISYRFQYELDATYLVGRIAFDMLDEYSNYARSVVAAEKGQLRLARRAVFFGTNHPDDRATPLSAEMLVAPLAQHLQARNPKWAVEHLAPEACLKERLEGLLGKADAPALLFTASHGIGYNPAVAAERKLQAGFQGALMCQDWPSAFQPPKRDYLLAAEDITDDFALHGMIAFHFACFGVGTPRFDNFTRQDSPKPKEVAPTPFLAALPRRLLSHPKGGALAVIGHVDRAVTYSFLWQGAGQQTNTFRDTLARLMGGQRVGLALDQFNLRYAQIAVQLTGMVNKAEAEVPDRDELNGLWTANSDARSYALLGDPAVRLPVAAEGEAEIARQALALKPVAFEVQARPAARAPVASPAAAPTRAASTVPAAGSLDAATVQELQQNIQAMADRLQALAETLSPPATGGGGVEDFGLFGSEKIDELTAKLQEVVRSLGDRAKEFANDVTSLTVRTYVSRNIEEITFQDGKITGEFVQRALTHVKLDGDTEIVVPMNASGVDEVVWQIHSQAVEQAQANRAAMLRVVVELATGLLPPVK